MSEHGLELQELLYLFEYIFLFVRGHISEVPVDLQECGLGSEDNHVDRDNEDTDQCQNPHHYQQCFLGKLCCFACDQGTDTVGLFETPDRVVVAHHEGDVLASEVPLELLEQVEDLLIPGVGPDVVEVVEVGVIDKGLLALERIRELLVGNTHYLGVDRFGVKVNDLCHVQGPPHQGFLWVGECEVPEVGVIKHTHYPLVLLVEAGPLQEVLVVGGVPIYRQLVESDEQRDQQQDDEGEEDGYKAGVADN